MDLASATRKRAALRAEGRKLVVTNGCFDLLHPGHLHFLSEARKLGDALWVLLNSDASVRQLKGPDRPILSEDDRATALTALRAVDGVILFESARAHRELAALQPDVYAKAGDYTFETLDPGERNALVAARAKMVFLPFLDGFSTTHLIDRIRRVDRL